MSRREEGCRGISAHHVRRPMGMQSAIVHRRVSPTQGLQAFPQNGPGRQVQAGRPPRPLPRLPDSWPWLSRPILPLRGRAGRRVQEDSLSETTPPPPARGAMQNKEGPWEESSGSTARHARGSNTNRGSRMRGAAGRPVDLHQGGCPSSGILGHRLPGDAHHPEAGSHPGPGGHPQLTPKAGGHRGRSPSTGGDSLQGSAG